MRACARACSDTLPSVARRGCGTAAFFASYYGTPFRYQTVVAVFLALVRSLGLRPGSGHPGPRVVWTLAWQGTGPTSCDVEGDTPALLSVIGRDRTDLR
jgi:hypothetical protein